MAMYTTVDHEIQRKLEITCNEWCVAHLIHIWSYNPDNSSAWCYATKETIASCLYLSKGTVLTIIEKLINKGMVEKHPITKHLRSTSFWYNTCENTGTVSIPPVQKPTKTGTDIIPEAGTETVPNNNISSIIKNDSKNTPPNNLFSLNTVLNTNTIQSEIPTPEATEFASFQKYILDYAPSLAKMEQPFTFDEFLKVKKWQKEDKPGYTKQEIFDQLAIMHNKKASKENRSAFFTLISWTNNRLKWNEQKTNQQ